MAGKAQESGLVLDAEQLDLPTPPLHADSILPRPASSKLFTRRPNHLRRVLVPFLAQLLTPAALFVRPLFIYGETSSHCGKKGFPPHENFKTPRKAQRRKEQSVASKTSVSLRTRLVLAEFCILQAPLLSNQRTIGSIFKAASLNLREV